MIPTVHSNKKFMREIILSELTLATNLPASQIFGYLSYTIPIYLSYTIDKKAAVLIICFLNKEGLSVLGLCRICSTILR